MNLPKNKCGICGLSTWCDKPIVLFHVNWNASQVCANCRETEKPLSDSQALSRLREAVNELGDHIGVPAGALVITIPAKAIEYITQLRDALRSIIGVREDIDEIIWEVLKDEYKNDTTRKS